MINENQVDEILSRRQRNESISQIARTMNLSRPTVRRYANMPEEQAQQARTHQKLNRCSILDEYRDQIERIFYDTEGNCVNVQEVFAKLHPEMQPSLRLIQWYCQKEGFRSCLRHTRATKHTRSIETSPGFEVQIDFGEKTVSVNSEPTTIHFLLRLWGTAEKSMPCSTKPQTLKRGRTVWSKHSCTLAVFRDTWFVITRKPSFINRQPMVNQSSTTSDSKQFVATGVRILKPVSPTIQRKKAK